MRYLLCNRLLRAAMRATDTTQTALAEEVGIKQESIYYLLQKPCDTKAENALAIADALGVDLSALLIESPGEAGDLPISRAMDIAKRWGVEAWEVVG